MQGTNKPAVVLSVVNAKSDTFPINDSTGIQVNQFRSVMGFVLMDMDTSKRTGYIVEVET